MADIVQLIGLDKNTQQTIMYQFLEKLSLLPGRDAEWTHSHLHIPAKTVPHYWPHFFVHWDLSTSRLFSAARSHPLWLSDIKFFLTFISTICENDFYVQLRLCSIEMWCF